MQEQPRAAQRVAAVPATGGLGSSAVGSRRRAVTCQLALTRRLLSWQTPSQTMTGLSFSWSTSLTAAITRHGGAGALPAAHALQAAQFAMPSVAVGGSHTPDELPWLPGLQGWALWRQQFCAMVAKRALCAARDAWAALMQARGRRDSCCHGCD